MDEKDGKKSKEQVSLFDEDNEKDTEETLHINEKFASKFEKRKNEEELAYARKILDEGSESDESEDEDGNLLSGNVNCKILDTLQRIRNKDSSIYDSKVNFFSSADFFEERRKKKEEKEKDGDKKVMYRDFLRETLEKEGAEAFNIEEDRLKAGKREDANEMDDIKKEIAKFGGDSDDDDGEDWLLKKPAPNEDNDGGVDEQTKKQNRAVDVLAQKYWADGENLTENEQFLRDYIVNEGWRDGSTAASSSKSSSWADKWEAKGMTKGLDGDLDEDEDEEDVEAADEFEHEYNFRFEEEGGCEIQTHARTIPNSVRVKDDKRKRKRAEREERKRAEAVRRTEELKRLKNLKAKELRRRLRQVEEIAGKDAAIVEKESSKKTDKKAALKKKTLEDAINEEEEEVDQNTMEKLKKFESLLDGDYDPSKHDEQMAAYLGEDYDEEDEVLDPKTLKEQILTGEEDIDMADAVADLEEEGEGDWHDEEGEGDWQADVEMADATDTVGGEEEEPWFLCDECEKPIPAGKNFFESRTRPDFTLCQKCFKGNPNRTEKFHRQKVPSTAVAPKDFDLEEYRKEKANASRGMQDDDANNSKGLQQHGDDDDDYDLSNVGPVRFKYTQVAGDDFGLSIEDILKTDDKVLNRKASLKKITRPYHDISTYRDERMEKYDKAMERQKKQKRTQQKKSGISRDRLEAYKTKTVVLKR